MSADPGFTATPPLEFDLKGKEPEVSVVKGRFKFDGKFHDGGTNMPIRDEKGTLLGVTNPRRVVHVHTLGAEGTFFDGLNKGKLLGTRCFNTDCESKGTIYLPFRTYCPDCLVKNRKFDLTKKANETARVHTFIVMKRSGAFNTLDLPIVFISVEIDWVSTILMSYMLCGEPSIGDRIKPIFRTKNPTYTITDLAWVPYDLPKSKLPTGFSFSL